MALKYTEEQLNSLDRETLIRLFLSQQEQLENIDHTLQLVLEQMADLKRHRFGRSSEKHEIEDQMSFMEVDGKIVFFNEAEAVAAEENTQEEPESVSRRKPKKKQGKREEDLDGLPVVVVEHSMTDEELEDKFGKDGWKQLPDEVYRRYSFTPGEDRGGGTPCKGVRRKGDGRCHKGAASADFIKGEPCFPFAGGSGNERQICQCRPALPAGTGV